MATPRGELLSNRVDLYGTKSQSWEKAPAPGRKSRDSTGLATNAIVGRAVPESGRTLKGAVDSAA